MPSDRVKRRFVQSTLSVIGVLAALLFNVYILDYLIVTYPCAYHAETPTFLFSIFYDITAGSGGHPVQSDVNVLVTSLLGAFFGWKLGTFALWRYDVSSADSAAG